MDFRDELGLNVIRIRERTDHTENEYVEVFLEAFFGETPN